MTKNVAENVDEQPWTVAFDKRSTEAFEAAMAVVPVSASATESTDILVFTNKGPVPAPRSRALEIHEIPGIVNLYHEAALKAKIAGFDGVEVLAAGGYLLDQFLQNGTYLRTDAYGGSVETRARLLLEVSEAVTEIFSPNRVAVRLSPQNLQGTDHRCRRF